MERAIFMGCWVQVKGQGEDLEPRSPANPLQRVAIKESREMGPGLEINVRGENMLRWRLSHPACKQVGLVLGGEWGMKMNRRMEG